VIYLVEKGVGGSIVFKLCGLFRDTTEIVKSYIYIILPLNYLLEKKI